MAWPGYLVIDYVHRKRRDCVRRAITVTKVTRRRGGAWATAFCHLRKAPRTFPLDGIAAVIDGETGELVTQRARVEALVEAAASARAGRR